MDQYAAVPIGFEKLSMTGRYINKAVTKRIVDFAKRKGTGLTPKARKFLLQHSNEVHPSIAEYKVKPNTVGHESGRSALEFIQSALPKKGKSQASSFLNSVGGRKQFSSLISAQKKINPKEAIEVMDRVNTRGIRLAGPYRTNYKR